MIERRSKDAADESADPVVLRAATLLREPEPVRAAWRDQLLTRVSSAAQPARRLSRIWIPVGIAAVLCVTVGIKELSVNHGADRIRFSVSAPSARRVSLVGDFDGWNPSAVPMRRASSNVWIADVRLRPGRHVFAFAIDGALRADSTAPRAVEDDFGVPGSVIVVPEPQRGVGRGSD